MPAIAMVTSRLKGTQVSPQPNSDDAAPPSGRCKQPRCTCAGWGFVLWPATQLEKQASSAVDTPPMCDPVCMWSLCAGWLLTVQPLAGRQPAALLFSISVSKLPIFADHLQHPHAYFSCCIWHLAFFLGIRKYCFQKDEILTAVGL